MADIKKLVFDALQNDATLTAIIGDRVVYNYIEDPAAGPAVVFVCKLVETVKELTGEVIGKIYAVNVKCISESQAQVYEIVEAVENLLVLTLAANNETDDEPIFEPDLGVFTMNVDFEKTV